LKLKLLSGRSGALRRRRAGLAGAVQKSSGLHTVALSGGRIAKTFFAAVADLAKASGATLANVHFFWADERCVEPTDPESNFRLAWENLLRPLGIAPDKIHRLKGERLPSAAVAEASHDIRRVVPWTARGCRSWT
jgi:6-phosphogluconolactonase